ncbi:hypothetical protein JQN72_13805 [Phycicoccus sp. CSK15P-2]|uniref:hypothetical protein n=1 Tax=Phycicoccus sp. CSK15P-2 TaxID=2807627 RepID=UPI00194DFEF1|nr:hypothetical protein [Phycicoccus sp. CSK15P-2]MBM6405315.1 hypothetical protein [Phycicoccus sp. CSK15P-2]
MNLRMQLVFAPKGLFEATFDQGPGAQFDPVESCDEVARTVRELLASKWRKEEAPDGHRAMAYCEGSMLVVKFDPIGVDPVEIDAEEFVVEFD